MTDSDSPNYCAAQIRRFDPDRYMGALYAPEDRRLDLFALYAFNLEIAKTRETVSEPLLGRMRLQWWRDTLTSIFEGAPPQHQVATPLAAAVARRDLSRQRLERLIDARERDLDDSPIADLDALESYAEATSAPLSALALDILGADVPVAGELARHAGTAWALTGILRAVPHHARAHRVYLPHALMEEFGLSRDSLLRMESSPAAARVAQRVADCARMHLDRAGLLSRSAPAQAWPALLPLPVARIVLRRLARRNFDPFAKGIEPAPTARHLCIGWAALTKRI